MASYDGQLKSSENKMNVNQRRNEWSYSAGYQRKVIKAKLEEVFSLKVGIQELKLKKGENEEKYASTSNDCWAVSFDRGIESRSPKVNQARRNSNDTKEKSKLNTELPKLVILIG